MATVTFDHVSKRPEHLELGPDAGDAAITIPANVDVVSGPIRTAALAAREGEIVE